MPTNLDQPYDSPTRELLTEVGGVALDANDRDYVAFRALCGWNGYFCCAKFRDHVGTGCGKTPREALRSLAKNLRQLADKVDKVAGDADDL